MKIVFKTQNIEAAARGATAAPAVIPNSKNRLGFTLLELLAVVVIIGILAALAYASLMDLILSNRAKESAQTMRTFAEAALAEGKRQSKIVTISGTVNTNNIQYKFDNDSRAAIIQPLSSGFTINNTNSNAPTCVTAASGESFAFLNNGLTSKLKIGVSGADTSGYFVACGARSYCAAAVKTKARNSFTACIRRGSSAAWEAI